MHLVGLEDAGDAVAVDVDDASAFVEDGAGCCVALGLGEAFCEAAHSRGGYVPATTVA